MHDEDYSFRDMRDGDSAPYDMHGRDLRGNFPRFGENSLIAFILILMVQSELHSYFYILYKSFNVFQLSDDNLFICWFRCFKVSVTFFHFPSYRDVFEINYFNKVNYIILQSSTVTLNCLQI